MRRNARISLLTLLMTLVALTTSAQEGPRGVIEYFDDPFELTITDADGFEYVDIYIGYSLQPGDTVSTGSTTAEIRLDPNGSVIKLAEDTQFTLAALQGVGGSETNSFAIAAGRMRTIAARVAGANYEVRTPTAVGGVRGTDFINEVRDGIDLLAVREGLVEFTKSATGESLQVAAGQIADTFADTFAAIAASAEELGGLFDEMEFLEAEPPADEPTADTDSGDDEQPAEDEEPAEDTEVAQTESQDQPPAVDPVVIDPPSDEPDEEPESEPADAGGDGAVDAAMAAITEALALEIGSVALDGETYGKLIAQPQFSIGNLKLGLFLPIIYSGNLFDPDDWYKPGGNDEWSFSTDQDWRGEPLVALGDLVGDLALKIKYVEWGEQRDPFFLKVGNLRTLTLGHGILMRNYANDTDFPAVRRVGFNIGIDREKFGFETVVNDLAEPEIFGTRIYARPAAPNFDLAIGLSSVLDIAPASALPSEADDGTALFDEERTADPMFISLAVDLDLPIVERDALSAILFTDVGGLLPYLRSGVGALEPGAQFQTLLYEDADGARDLRNYGLAAGVFGGISLLDYRLEFRNYHGTFRPAFFNETYDRRRGEYVREVLTYLQNSDDPAYDAQTIGVYGEAGVSIMELVTFKAGYLWPWTRDTAGQIVIGDEDYLLASLQVAEGLIPLGITAGINYERTNFVPTLLDKEGFAGATLFDENTVLAGEIVYPVAPILDIVATVSTAVLRDESGQIRYEQRSDGSYRPKIGPIIGVETRVGF